MEVALRVFVERYELLERLTEGGMAEVHLARAKGPAGFSREVVIKRLLPDLQNDAEYQEMIIDEAQILAMLCHENIVQVFDVGWDGERLYIAMEYVEGVSVQTILYQTSHRHVRMPLEHTLSIVMGVAAGLDYAHRRVGIVHRDVSLDNIMVTSDGCAKLIDFGVAKASLRQSHTPAGTLKGKLAYMSPEQIAFGRVDHRSDVFSMGVVLYEMTTGRRLFRGKDDLGTMRKVVQQPMRPPSELVGEYPPMLEDIVMRALDRDPDQRQQSARELHQELESLVYDYDLRLSRYALASYLDHLLETARPDQPEQADATGPSPTPEPASPPEASESTDDVEGDHSYTPTLLPAPMPDATPPPTSAPEAAEALPAARPSGRMPTAGDAVPCSLPAETTDVDKVPPWAQGSKRLATCELDALVDDAIAGLRVPTIG